MRLAHFWCFGFISQEYLPLCGSSSTAHADSAQRRLGVQDGVPGLEEQASAVSTPGTADPAETLALGAFTRLPAALPGLRREACHSLGRKAMMTVARHEGK